MGGTNKAFCVNRNILSKDLYFTIVQKQLFTDSKAGLWFEICLAKESGFPKTQTICHGWTMARCGVTFGKMLNNGSRLYEAKFLAASPHFFAFFWHCAQQKSTSVTTQSFCYQY